MVIQARRNRQTGTVVEVIDDRDGFVGYGGPWVTFCADHSQFVTHDTKALALDFAPVPAAWCPDCTDILDQKGST